MTDVDDDGPQIIPGRAADVAGLPVQRLLPRPTRRTIGAWCFLDSFGPVGPGTPMEVGPHPHIGLHTVTWLLDGEVVHRDSLGSEQAIRPGQLNLMTAGHGISHAEESPPQAGRLHGAQLWVAQPEATRHGPPAFEHHAELPVVGLSDGRAAVGSGGRATVLVGTFGGVRSPARADTPLLGVELRLDGRTSLAIDPTFEHGITVLEGVAALDDAPLPPGTTTYLAPGRIRLGLSSPGPATVLLLGGLPLEQRLFMWWNFVARSAEEIEQARADWEAGLRFGSVASMLDRVPAPPFGT